MMTLDWYVWLPLMVGCFGCGYGMGNMDSREQIDEQTDETDDRSPKWTQETIDIAKQAASERNAEIDWQ